MRITQNCTSVIGSLKPFDPETDNWLAYTKRLEQFFAVNSVPDDNTKKVAGQKEFNPGNCY